MLWVGHMKSKTVCAVVTEETRSRALCCAPFPDSWCYTLCFKYKNGWGSCLWSHAWERLSLKMIRQNWPVLIYFLNVIIFGGTFPLLSGLLFSVNEPYKGATVWHYCHFDSDETASLSLCVMHKPYDAVCRQCQLWCVIFTLFIFFIIITSLKFFS